VALLAFYDVTDAQRDRLLRTAQTLTSSRLDRGIPGVADTVLDLAEYERGARGMTDWSPLIVPGLLQTPEYSLAIAAMDGVPRESVGPFLMARQQRQDKMLSERRRYTAYVDELVFRRRVVHPEAFGEQVRHLITMSRHESVTVRITPAVSVGREHPGLTGAFLLLEYADEAPVVHIEQRRTAVYLEGLADTRPYVEAVAQLAALSLDTRASTEFLEQLIKED
jgi:hypothetical protein